MNGTRVPSTDYGHSDVRDDEHGPDTHPRTWLAPPAPGRDRRAAELVAHLKWMAGAWLHPAGSVGHREQR